jgi:hypothetical protein
VQLGAALIDAGADLRARPRRSTERGMKYVALPCFKNGRIHRHALGTYEADSAAGAMVQALEAHPARSIETLVIMTVAEANSYLPKSRQVRE